MLLAFGRCRERIFGNSDVAFRVRGLRDDVSQWPNPTLTKNGKQAESERKKGNPITLHECRDLSFFKLLYLLSFFVLIF